MAFYQWDVYQTTYMVATRGTIGWTINPLPAGYMLFNDIGGVGGYPSQYRGIIDPSLLDIPTPTLPEVGDQSLLFERNPQQAPVLGFASVEAANLTPKASHFTGAAPFDKTPYSKGLTEGALRGAWAVNFSPIMTNTATSWGFCFMQSQDDLTTGTPNFYMARFRPKNIFLGSFFNDSFVEIVKFSGANLTGSGVTISNPSGSHPIETPSVLGPVLIKEKPFTMEVRWSADPLYNGAVYIEVYTGYALDYSDLTFQTSALDFTTPFTTSVGEGPACIAQAGSAFNLNHDNTELLTISGYTTI